MTKPRMYPIGRFTVFMVQSWCERESWSPIDQLMYPIMFKMLLKHYLYLPFAAVLIVIAMPLLLAEQITKGLEALNNRLELWIGDHTELEALDEKYRRGELPGIDPPEKSACGCN